jgi:hypothetical protein
VDVTAGEDEGCGNGGAGDVVDDVLKLQSFD